MVGPPPGLRRRDRPPGRPFRPDIATSDQLLVGHIRPDHTLRTGHQLLDHPGEPVHQPGPHNQGVGAQPGLPASDQTSHHLRVTPRQRRSAVSTPRFVESFQNLHRLHTVLLHVPPEPFGSNQQPNGYPGQHQGQGPTRRRPRTRQGDQLATKHDIT